MKAVAFDRSKAYFDRFDRFWIEGDGFLRFETGEVAYTMAEPNPSDRRHYAEYEVTLFMPGDTHAPKLFTRDGVAVPAAQLDINGKPYLLWDHNHNMVVRLARQRNTTTIPRDLRFTLCYWAADDSKPVTGGGVFYTPPNALTPEQKEFMKECKALVPTVLAMRQDNSELGRIATIRQAPRQGDVQLALAQGVPPIRFLEQFTYGNLTVLKQGGASWLSRTPIEVPYLVAK